MKRIRIALIAVFVMALSPMAVHASSIELVPTLPTADLAVGDMVSFDIFMDFSDVGGTLGGGFNVVFDSAALMFVGLVNAGLGDPFFGRDPDIMDGLLESWGVGNFDALSVAGPALIGSVMFQLLDGLLAGESTIVEVTGTNGIAGPWVSGVEPFEGLDPQPDYNQVSVMRMEDIIVDPCIDNPTLPQCEPPTGVPEPGTLGLLGLGLLGMGLARRRKIV